MNRLNNLFQTFVFETFASGTDIVQLFVCFSAHSVATFATRNRKWPNGSCARPDRVTWVTAASYECWTPVDCTGGRPLRLLTDRALLCSRFSCHFGVSSNRITT